MAELEFVISLDGLDTTKRLIDVWCCRPEGIKVQGSQNGPMRLGQWKLDLDLEGSKDQWILWRLKRQVKLDPVSGSVIWPVWEVTEVSQSTWYLLKRKFAASNASGKFIDILMSFDGLVWGQGFRDFPTRIRNPSQVIKAAEFHPTERDDAIYRKRWKMPLD